MLRWITKSRLHTALAMLFFVVAFIVSGFLLVDTNNGLAAPELPSGTLAAPSLPIASIVGLVTGIVSIVGTVSTVILAWRADRRTAKESELKLVQLQQQIVELQTKLISKSDSKLA